MRILFTGDSITDANRDKRNYHDLGDGYARYTAELLQRELPKTVFEFINTGISANRTGQLFDRIYYDAVMLEPDLVVLLIGINDLGRRYKSGSSHIETSDGQIELNYRSILEQLRKYTNAKIVMMAPFILDAEINKLFPLDTPSGEHMRRDLQRIAPIIKALSKQYADAFIPLDELFDRAMKSQPTSLYFSADGIHPNARGAELIGNACAETIKNLIS